MDYSSNGGLFFLGGHCHVLFFKPPLDFYHELVRTSGEFDFFHLTATWGLISGGVHPKFWVLFFLGGHCHEYFFYECKGTRQNLRPVFGGHCQEFFFQPPLDFYYECKEGKLF